LSSIVLTPFAGAYYLSGVNHGSGLVETLPKPIPDEGAWCCVVAADAPVDVLKALVLFWIIDENLVLITCA
jgi:hypothetical protein